MKVLSNYLKRSKVVPRLKNADLDYPKKLKKLEKINEKINVLSNKSRLSNTLYDLGYYMKRIQQRSGISTPLWRRMRENIIIPPSVVRGVDVLISRNSVPIQPVSSTPVVYETGFVTNDYVDAKSVEDRREEIERELWKIQNFEFYILKTRESIRRFSAAAKATTGENVREEIHYVPYFLPEVEMIERQAFDEKFSSFEPVRILFVGTDGARKGVHNLVEALNRLCERYPDLRDKVRTTIVTRNDLPPCKIKIEKHDFLSRGEVLQAFREAHIFCMPTLKDAYGLVYVEAMAAGCAVIADDSPVRNEILGDGKAGLFSDPQDCDDIADKLAKLICAPEHTKNMAEAGRKRFRRCYHWTHVGQAYVDILKRAATR